MSEVVNNRLLDRFARWQGKTNEQFGYYNNLLLGLSIASLAYLINFFDKETFHIESCTQKFICLSSLILLLVSSAAGSYLGFNRLKDFRKTTKLISHRIEGQISEVEALKQQTKYLGDLSWGLLYFQIFTFMFGEIFLVVFLTVTYSSKFL